MKNRGMTLFIAIIIMGILLFISFAVVNITIKGSLFATSGRDSQFAFYAADAGLECALYWDSKLDKFSTSTTPSSISCAWITIGDGEPIYGTTTPSGATVFARIGGGGDTNPTSLFGFVMNQGLNQINSCTIVTVRKYYEANVLKTYIKSRGYNTCDENPRRLERGVEVTY